MKPLRTSLMRLCLSIALALVAGLLARDALAQSASDSRDAAEQLIRETTIVFARIDPARIELPASLAPAAGNAVDALATWPRQLEQKLQWLRELTDSEPVYVTLDIPSSTAYVTLQFHLKADTEQRREQLSERLARLGFPSPVVNGNFLSLTPTQSRASNPALAAGNAAATQRVPPLMIAMQTIDSHPVQMVISPPEYFFRTFRELAPQLPEQFGGGPSSVLTEGIQWAAIGLDPGKLQVHAEVQSDSESAASLFATQLPKMVSALIQHLPEGQFAASKQIAVPLLGRLAPRVDGSRLTISLDGLAELGPTTSLLGAITDQIVTPLNRRAKMDRFKQLGLAMHNYHEAFGCFPPAQQFRGSGGKSGLSWRVHLLPFLGETELYRQFDLKQPWDSPQNLPLVEKMPDAFRLQFSDLLAPTPLKPGYTTVLAPEGEGTIAGGVEAVKISRIVDGTSNTLFFVEVKPELAVPWTAPQDYQFDPSDPAAGCESHFAAGMADGSVHWLSSDLPAETLLHLFQMNDGQVGKW